MAPRLGAFAPAPGGNGTGMTTSHDARAKVTELIRDARICMFTTMTEDGRHVSRPMGLQEAEFDGDLWFFAHEASDKVREIDVHPQVNLAFTNKHGAWVSISGTAAVVYDQVKAQQLWTPLLKAWFPDGLDTPGLTLIKVHADSAEYWEAPHGRVVTLIGYLTSAVRHKPPQAGENVELDLNA